MSNRESNIGGRRSTGPSVPNALPRHIGTAVITLWLALWVALAAAPGLAEMAADAPPLPLLVRASGTDSPATLAERYLHDPGKGWMIVEYNHTDTFTDGQPVLIPMAPYRPGGLFPNGYQQVPVLAYADIGASPGPDGRIGIDAFKDQMTWLRDEGFTTVTPVQLLNFMAFSGQLPEKAVLVTIDSESRQFFESAAPVLGELGFRATLFVASDAVGRGDAMSWEQLGQLQQQGITIGCRGRSGRSLIVLGGSDMKTRFRQAAADLYQAKQAIESHLKRPCTALAWPGGETAELLAATAAKIGFEAGFVKSAGETAFFADRFGIHRIVVAPKTSIDRFARQLTILTQTDLQR